MTCGGTAARLPGGPRPGLIAATAGNDAGGIATYSSVAAKYGYDLIREQYGIRWSMFTTASVLAPFAGRFAEVLFAVGLLGASLLAGGGAGRDRRRHVMV